MGERKATTLRLTPELKARVEQEAEGQGISVNALISVILAQHFPEKPTVEHCPDEQHRKTPQ